MDCREESKTTVKELRDMLDELIRQGKGDYKVDFIIFTCYECDNHDSSPTGILEWSVGMEKDRCKDNKFESFEYALYQLRQYVFRNIILELKRIA